VTTKRRHSGSDGLTSVQITPAQVCEGNPARLRLIAVFIEWKGSFAKTGLLSGLEYLSPTAGDLAIAATASNSETVPAPGISTYKPKDLNRDWSPRFSTLRIKTARFEPKRPEI
jgi:hypothetical protein